MSERIIDTNVKEQYELDAKRYAIYVSRDRVTPDFRDGLKPVQRRVTYGTYKQGYTSLAKKKKSADIVGNVMAKYHPHGDSSIYGTIVNLANWYKIKMPLFYPEGNWGSVMGDGPASMRYTETALNTFAMDCVLKDLDLNNNTVDWTSNYDESTIEPLFLAPTVPLLLINGSMGIGVGMKIDIPRHNLVEVVDAMLKLIENPNASVVLIPDMCMPCELVNTNWKSICNHGFGNFKARGVVEETEYKGYPALVIKSLPDYTTLDTVVEKIEDMIEKKMILQIRNTFDFSDNNHVEYVIQLKQGSDTGYVKDMLYKNTALEASCRVNFEVLDGLKLMRMSYKSYLLNFIEFRKHTKFRLHCNEVQEYKTRFHHIDAFIKVIESGQIDFIYNSIKKRKDTNDNELIEFLIKKVGLTDLQAAFIINSDLKKFSIGYLNKYKEEAKMLVAKIDDLMKKILDDKFIEAEIIEELKEIKAKYGSPRLCKVIDVAEANSIPQGTFVFIITNNNFIKKIPAVDNLSAYRDDGIRCIGTFNNTDSLLLFDERGKVMKVDAHKIPLTAKNNAGTDLRLLNKSIGANIVYMTSKQLLEPLKDEYPKNFITMVTKNGNCKKIDLDDCIAASPSGIFYIKVDPDDAVKQILVLNETDHVMVYSDKKAIKFSVSTMPYLKRGTKGSRAMANATTIDGMSKITTSDKEVVIVVTDSGRVNKISSIAVPLNERGGNGNNVIKLGKTDKIKAVVCAEETDVLRLRTIDKNFIDIPVKEIQLGSSVSSGTKYTTAKDQVINVQVIKQS